MMKIQDIYSFEIWCEDVRITRSEEGISVEVSDVNEENLQRMINEFYCEDILKIIGEKDIVNYLEENGYSVIKREEE
ncbi:hypothetical protein [Photorhabdus hindustanensis]|uniref:Uncharacterized protein n=1 Tax=Photorhabdus hindustanensis TaxID=2918802 RepID=A0A2S8PV65_9GAMM|nr:hypothetical protein [Photorhabdus hindustanensis]PQQ22788.1 hypothetical protein C6H66_22135 [Photorhabdus hindustanensis]